jgi:ribonucleoside-diphosphate reductase alpha chain
MKDIEIPSSWEQGAFDILVSKYFRKTGVPQFNSDGTLSLDSDGNPILGPERSAKQWANRLASAWASWGMRGGYFNENSASIFRDEMIYILLAQMASPNSPQHFNTGLFESYNIIAPPEGNWYFDPKVNKAKLSKHRYERAAVNACFIQSVKDELVGDDSIFDLWEREARLFKSGSGTGTNFSTLRGKGEKLSGGGTSSGVMSFLRVGDRSAGTIQSGGTTRRAAKMVILDVDHPEIEDFVQSKVIEEHKAQALINAGFDPAWNAEGGAYDSVSFQNGNHSVRISQGFLEAVRNNTQWDLIGRVDGKVTKTISARSLWNQIAEAAWACADPGVQYDDILNDWNTVPNDGPLRATNPCSEYTHLEDTACNLASLNLVKFFDQDTQSFDVESFIYVTRLYTIMLEISVSMSHYPSAILAKNSFEHRTLGLGYANLGALLMRAGLPYDSNGGRAAMGAITALLTEVAYSTSAEMAKVLGPAVAYTRNQEPMARVLRNHARAAIGSQGYQAALGEFESLTVIPQLLNHNDLANTPLANLSPAVIDYAKIMLKGTEKSGYRNLQVTVLAPTGTIGLQMGCDTTGIEPDYALVKSKKLAGGGFLKIVNSSVLPALHTLNYTQEEAESILEWALGTNTLHVDTAINFGSLCSRGLSAEVCNRIEKILPQVTELEHAFTPYIVGIDTLVSLGLDESDWLSPDFSLLRSLGFTTSEIDSSSKRICGHQTVQGAPALNPAHLPVFDTANYCGDGTRVISWEGHVRALGAVAPFLSGSASKTVNLPKEASVEDIKAAYETAYSLGVKCVSVYRDQSKLSQVLTSTTKDAREEDEERFFTYWQDIPEGTSPTEYYQNAKPPKFKLPALRFGPTWKFSIANTEVFLHAGEYADGTLGEIFIDLSKEGSTLKGTISCFAIAVSQGLQYGLPLDKLVDTFTFQTFEPRGMVSGSPNLKMANSIIDAVFRLLAYHYLNRTDLVQIPAEVIEDMPKSITTHKNTAPEIKAANDGTPLGAFSPVQTIDKASGKLCDLCGGNMLHSGSCYVCSNCATTTGCS